MAVMTGPSWLDSPRGSYRITRIYRTLYVHVTITVTINTFRKRSHHLIITPEPNSITAVASNSACSGFTEGSPFASIHQVGTLAMRPQ